ncbi:DegT/DnrJ/EryC1/StrS family aminotransferase [Hydrogenimonas sp.]
MRIDFANLQRQYQAYKEEIDQAIQKVLDHGKYIMGPEVAELERGLEVFTGARQAITCSSGTDALLLAMMALNIGPGDEVITTPFTFIATAEAIALLGAKPVFVDIDQTTCNIDVSKIEAAITESTRVIMPVSLYGQPADLDKIGCTARRYGLKVIVDGAQSFGAAYRKKAEVHFCDLYTTSFFPAKPLGCYGDGGAVLTNDEVLAEKIRMLRVHGQSQRYHHKYIGLGARLDTIQAAILGVKLKYYPDDLSKRQNVARIYTKLLKTNNLKLKTPFVKEDRTSVWAQYSIRIKNRDMLQKKLKEKGIPTAIHYPAPLHLQECFSYLGYERGDFPAAEAVSSEILSLPMNPYVTEEESLMIVQTIKDMGIESK